MVQIRCAVCSQQFNKIKPKALRFSSRVNTDTAHVLRQPGSRVGHTLVQRLGVGNKV